MEANISAILRSKIKVDSVTSARTLPSLDMSISAPNLLCNKEDINCFVSQVQADSGWTVTSTPHPTEVVIHIKYNNK